jgi:hypothetical protein
MGRTYEHALGNDNALVSGGAWHGRLDMRFCPEVQALVSPFREFGGSALFQPTKVYLVKHMLYFLPLQKEKNSKADFTSTFKIMILPS